MRRRQRLRLVVLAVVVLLLLRGSAAEGMHIAQVSFSGEGSEFSMAVLRFAYNGEELIHFNYTTSKFVASKPLAESHADDLNQNKRVVKNVARYIRYMPLVSEVLEQAIKSLTVKPSIRIISRQLKGEENALSLMCRVDGFYPRDIDTTWLRNGEAIDQEELKSSILPNKDGTFQITLQININPSQGSTYSCQIKHLSIPGNLNEVWAPKNKVPVYGYVVGVIAGIVGILIALSGGIIKWKVHHDRGSQSGPNQSQAIALSDACANVPYSEVCSQGEADRLCEEVGHMPTLTLQA